MSSIVHLLPGIYLGGSEKVVESLCHHQQKLGHNVYVIAFEVSGRESFYSDLNILSCNVQYQDSLFHSKGIDVSEYEHIIDSIKPDIIHSHAYWTDLISRYRIRKSIQYISHFHLCYEYFDNLSLKDFFWRKIFHAVDKWRLINRYRKSNTRFIASSKFVDAFYRQRLPKELARKMRVINNPIDCNVDIGKREIKYELITVGRLEEVKNHVFLLEVMKWLKQQKVSCKLLIVGEGTLRQDLEAIRDRYDLNETVEFAGAIKPVYTALASALIYVHVSKSETFGLAIFEAMCAQLPVVVKLFEGIDEAFLQHEINCLVVDEEKPSVFGETILKLLAEPGLRTRLVSEAANTVLNFSLEKYLEQIDRLYNEDHG